MPEGKEGTTGIGHTGTTKYPAENAKVSKEPNDALHNGSTSEQSPESMYKGSEGSLNKSKGK